MASAYSKPARECRGLNVLPAGRREQPSLWLRVAERQSEDICTDQHTPEILTSDKPAGCRSPPCMFSQIKTQKWGEPVPLEWSDPTTDGQMETGSWTNLAEMAPSAAWQQPSDTRFWFAAWFVWAVQICLNRPTDFSSPLLLLLKSFCNPHLHRSGSANEPLQDCPAISLGWWDWKLTPPHLDALQLKRMNNAGLRLYVLEEGAGVTCRCPSLLPSVMWNKRLRSSMFCSEK